jgi:hypothetical protein
MARPGLVGKTARGGPASSFLREKSGNARRLLILRCKNAKYDLSEKWDFYLRYEWLSPSCSDSALDEFIVREEEQYCGMCSARRRPLELPRVWTHNLIQ